MCLKDITHRAADILEESYRLQHLEIFSGSVPGHVGHAINLTCPRSWRGIYTYFSLGTSQRSATTSYRTTMEITLLYGT